MRRWPGDASTQATTFGKLSRSMLMARVRSTGNQTTEIRMARLLRTAGLSGWRRHQPLPGKPDFCWRKEKVVLFVDGCFWHGHDCRNLHPRTNAQAWADKIKRNRERDYTHEANLTAMGWHVVRIWECALKKYPEECLGRIAKVLRPDVMHPED